MVRLAASRGRRLAFFDVAVAFVPALMDELVILLLPGGLGQGLAAVLHKPPHGTRKASKWQRFLRDVLVDAYWKVSVMFASMYTLGDERGTLGCWGYDLLVERQMRWTSVRWRRTWWNGLW